MSCCRASSLPRSLVRTAVIKLLPEPQEYAWVPAAPAFHGVDRPGGCSIPTRGEVRCVRGYHSSTMFIEVTRSLVKA